MKLNVAIFILSLGIFSGVCAMEQEQSNQQIINLKLSDGQMVSFPAEVALHSSLLRTYLEDNEIHDDSPLVDFSEQQLCMHDIDDSDDKEKIHDLALNSKIVRAVFDCVIHGKKILHDLNKDELIAAFEVGDYLGIPQKTMRKLTRCIQKNIAENEQPQLVRISHYCNSIRNLYRDDVLQVILQRINVIHGFEEIECEPYRLIIKPQKIDELSGIEDLAQKYEKVCIREICLDNNSLKMLDVKQLIKLFPFVNMIFANNNKIEKLILPETLPAEFALLLQKNKIKELSNFKLGENGYIDLRNNPLSGSAQENIQRAMHPTLIELNRPLVNTLSSFDSFKNGAGSFFQQSLIIGSTISLINLGYATMKYYMGSTPSIISTFKKELISDMKSSFLLKSLGATLLASTGYVWYVSYFQWKHANETLWNSYQRPLIDYDQTSEPATLEK